jgi:hypothetical protein
VLGPAGCQSTCECTQAVGALATAGAAEHAVSLLRHCLAGFRAEFALCAGAAAAAHAAVPATTEPLVPQPPADADGAGAPGAAEQEAELPMASEEELLELFLQILPSFSLVAAAAAAPQLERDAFGLAHAHMPKDHPDLARVCCCCSRTCLLCAMSSATAVQCGAARGTPVPAVSQERAHDTVLIITLEVQIVLERVSFLSREPTADSAAAIEALLAELEHSTAHVPLEVQVQRAEAWLAAGDEAAFADGVAAVLEAQSALASESQKLLVRLRRLLSCACASGSLMLGLDIVA